MYDELDFSKITCLNYPDKCNDCKYHYTGTFDEENICIFELFLLHLGINNFNDLKEQKDNENNAEC